jgi:DNA polymerase-3 subunit gamma/tau
MLAFRPAQAAVPATSTAAPVSVAPVVRARPPAGTGETTAPPSAVSAEWSAIVAALDVSAGAKQLASNCALLGREGAIVRLALDPRSAMMRTTNLEEKLAQALSRFYGSPVRLEFELREVTPDTPARAAERNEAQLRSQAQVAFEADPVVESFKQRFGASVLSESVRSLKPNE